MKHNTAKGEKIKARSNKLTQINPRVAGIDVGMSLLLVCIGDEKGNQEVRSFGTYTAHIKSMIEWFKASSIKSVAMESTGVYWIPIYDMLSQAKIEVILANPYRLKTVPGRKTDVKDCEWIQQLHSYGLLSSSFRPDDHIVSLRTLTRHRFKLIELASESILRIQKALVQMNIQLTQVVSDVTGETGMKIIRAIIAGEHNPAALAKNRHVRCKSSEKEIALALEGNFRTELIFNLKQHVEHYDILHQKVNETEKEIEKIVATIPKSGHIIDPAGEPHTKEKRRKTVSNKTAYGFDVSTELKNILGVDITDIPGIEANIAMKIISEIGTDMSRWPTIKHFTSWLGLCPGNKKSGGKILSSKTNPSDNKAAQALRLGAYSLHHSNNALGAFFRKIRARLGTPKAITAAAHKMARILYTMIKLKKSYKELGLEAFEKIHREKTLKNLQRKAAAEGYKLVLADQIN